MVLLVEQSGQRLLRTINLRTSKESVHYFNDAKFEVGSENAIQEFFDIQFEDNLTFDSPSVRYRMQKPN